MTSAQSKKEFQMKVVSKRLRWIFCLIRISSDLYRTSWVLELSSGSFFFFLIMLAWKFNQSSLNSRHVSLGLFTGEGQVFLVCLWEPVNMTLSAVALKWAPTQPSYLVKSWKLMVRRRTAAAQLSVTLTCLLFWPSRLRCLWWLFCSPWRQQAGYLFWEQVIIKRIPGGRVNENVGPSRGDPPQQTWAKVSKLEPHIGKGRPAGGIVPLCWYQN